MPSKPPKQPQPPKGYRLAEHGEEYRMSNRPEGEGK